MAVMRTSIHGRRFGLSSTGGLLTGYDATGGQSTLFDQQAQMWGGALVSTAPADGGLISNSGITVIGAGTTNGSTFLIANPVAGLRKELLFAVCSATALNFETTSTSAFIRTTGTALGSTGSTHIDVDSDDPISGGITLMGISTAEWVITGYHGIAAPAT
jgi:hypothetical protein